MGIIALVALGGWIKINLVDRDTPFQARNLATGGLLGGVLVAILLWWMLLSRARWKQRFLGLGIALLLLGLSSAAFRIRGVSGDLVPILEPRWARASAPASVPVPAVSPAKPDTNANLGTAFPQFLGPTRNGILTGPTLASDWTSRPPQVAWRQPIGPAWSGFVMVGDRALTQEQSGPEERVTCYDRESGKLLWSHSDPERYANTIAGEGPRATPTIEGNRVFSLGALGRLNALDLATGRLFWTRSLTNEASCQVPEWGFSGSPLVQDGLVIVSAGGGDGRSLLAFRADTGEPAWTGGSSGVGYASPFPATLAGTRQILIVNHRSLASHDPRTGSVLWEVPFGAGMPLVANPLVTGPADVLVSAGYNVGAERFTVAPGTNAPVSVWKSKKLKAKFSNPVFRDGFVYGLDDGMLACLDVKDGSQRWKEGRYGHGQALLVGDLLVLMSEPGELILLKPTPDAPNELGRLSVLSSKTWNPIALQGNRLLVRNDQEAALVILPPATP